ncbi:DUF1294 domain-containing protein [Paenibacillus sp. LHD-117]|uniref:DUF1294 domain-containing protein n=1 Tax=Paenibacillus sp. LHD-117 TaxID=3071412 RepID=UPI0027DEE2FB|nr:DUF1294 domain-containing protein [Paenibacillus sp. LHD-117]MDQ6421608.1 DUF1294 domain-containing protein [Paenibacillus sp. LHD-117]
MTIIVWIIALLIVLNGFTFLLMGWDKRRAKQRGKRRVPEKRFFLLGAVGGALGVWYGMKAWRHKTQHRAFTVGIPYLIAVNLIVYLVLIGFIGMNAVE